MYQKEIIYMNLLKNEVKAACIGFLKYQQKESQYQVEIQLKNVMTSMSGSFPIRLQSKSGWQETGMLNLNEGNGRWTGTLSEEILRAEIILSDVYKVKGQSKNAEKPVIENVRAAGDKPVTDKGTKDNTRTERKMPDSTVPDKGIKSSEEADREVPGSVIADKEIENNVTADSYIGNSMANREIESSIAVNSKIADDTTANKDIVVNSTVSGTAPDRTTPEQTSAETVMRAESMPAPQKRMPSPRLAVKKEHAPLYENKWEQLLATYEQIHPYADNRIYVKLEPKDFIILRENYQHLVNNSFLLHGFYNYRYLILGKEQDFYLGVPGVFYEREKMVALMFGFEAFECEGGEAEEGKFGYYLRKVEL